MGRLRNENMALASQRDGANKVKRILEKKISGLLEKDLRMQRELEGARQRERARRGARGYFLGTRFPRTAARGGGRARNMLLERVNSSLAAVATARDGDASSPAPRRGPGTGELASDLGLHVEALGGWRSPKRPSPPPPFPAGCARIATACQCLSQGKRPHPAFEAAIAAASSTPAPPARPAAAPSPTAFELPDQGRPVSAEQAWEAKLERLSRGVDPGEADGSEAGGPGRPAIAPGVPALRQAHGRCAGLCVKVHGGGDAQEAQPGQQIRGGNDPRPGLSGRELLGPGIVPPSPHISHLASARGSARQGEPRRSGVSSAGSSPS